MSRRTAALLALLVTFLWSTSWVLIKIGLAEIPALTFAGLRYVLASWCLVPLVLRPRELATIRALRSSDWRRLVALGLVMYSLTQGAQFLALAYLPAQTTSLVLSFSPVVVALIGMAALSERPVPAQWWGVAVYLVGAVIFLYPADLPPGQRLGLAVAGVGLLANAGAAVLGRSVNRDAVLSPIAVTVLSMGIGSVVLLVTGLVTQGMPALTSSGWAIVGWLAVINTAVAFTLWNLSQRTLSAMDSSVINNTMLIQIALLAWLFLDEPLGPKEITGLSMAAVGVLVVQLRGVPGLRHAENGGMSRRRPRRPPPRLSAPGNDRIESRPDGEWVVRRLTGSSPTKPYRCPGCDQLIPPATPHIVAWPAEGATLSGGGTGERRHWHTACWQARDRRRPRGQ
jgi:drug/metabolite transporter (DMT)-like permease